MNPRPHWDPHDPKKYFFKLPRYENPMLEKRIFELSPIEKKLVWPYHTVIYGVFQNWGHLVPHWGDFFFWGKITQKWFITPKGCRQLKKCTQIGFWKWPNYRTPYHLKHPKYTPGPWGRNGGGGIYSKFWHFFAILCKNRKTCPVIW